MNKLLSVVVASTFALASFSTFAANNAGQSQPTANHAAAHQTQQASKATFHQVKHSKKKKHTKNHAKKAPRAA